MILVWGSRSDSPTTRVHDALLERGAPALWLDADGLDAVEADLVFGSRVEGTLSVEGRRFDVGEITGFYLRPVEPRVPSDRAASAVDSLLGLAAALDVRVINRPHFSRANNSKPYQLRLIRAFGLDVPETLVTTDVPAARAFVEAHGTVVYKSISGIRSIVSTLPAKPARLDSVADGPVQLQEHIAGVDVRVHVVGERTFACEARSRATDYRYAARQGFKVVLRAVEIPEGLARRIVSMSGAMGLHFAGVDFRRTPEGRWVCLEVNPSPAFTWYEDATGHRIADAVAALLQGSPRPLPYTPGREDASECPGRIARLRAGRFPPEIGWKPAISRASPGASPSSTAWERRTARTFSRRCASLSGSRAWRPE